MLSRQHAIDPGTRRLAGRLLSALATVNPLLPEASMDVLSLLQWPAMVVTLTAAWLVASQSKARRSWGFWTFIASNVLWILWGWHEDAIALILLQVGLFILNLRGARKNDPATS